MHNPDLSQSQNPVGEQHSVLVAWTGKCAGCQYPPCSVTSGTVFEATSLPLTRCFLAIQLLTQTKGNVPALELTRRLGVSYRTAPRGSSSTSGCANSMPSDRSCRAGPVAAAVPSAAVTTARVRHRTEAAPQST